jgi:hypothetical protein
MEGIEVNVAVNTISGMHLSLFHPLAEMTRRTSTGQSTKQNKFHK